MQKSADAFRTISEVADDLTLPQHVLRFWETRFPQIRPLKRAGGRRYYRPADVVLLKTIRQLLYDDGYTIKGVQRLLKEQGPKGLAAATASEPDVLAEDEIPKEHRLPAAANDLGPAPLAKADWDAPDSNRADAIAVASVPEPPVSSAAHRALLVEAVETIDECLRILLAVRRSS